MNNNIDVRAQRMINLLHELKVCYVLTKLDIAAKFTHTWCPPAGKWLKYFFCPRSSFSMENLGGGRLYEGMLFLSFRRGVIWDLTVHSHLKENLLVVSFIYSCHVMLTHNNTPLNFVFLWIIVLSKKTLGMFNNIKLN